MPSPEDEVSFSRVSRTGDDLGELRINTPKVVLSVIDMVAASEAEASGKMVSRTDIVNRVLSRFVDQKIHEASLITRAINSIPTMLDGGK